MNTAAENNIDDMITFEQFIELKNKLNEFNKNYQKKKFVSNYSKISTLIVFTYGFDSIEYDILEQINEMISEINNINSKIKYNDLIKKGETIDKIYVKKIKIKDYEKAMKLIEKCNKYIDKIFALIDSDEFLFKVIKIDKNEIKWLAKNLVFFGKQRI